MEGEMLADTYLSVPFIGVSTVSGLQYIGIHIYRSVKRYKSIGISRMTMATVTGLFKGTCVPLDRMRYMQSAVYAEISIGIPVDVRTLLA